MKAVFELSKLKDLDIESVTFLCFNLVYTPHKVTLKSFSHLGICNIFFGLSHKFRLKFESTG